MDGDGDGDVSVCRLAWSLGGEDARCIHDLGTGVASTAGGVLLLAVIDVLSVYPKV